MNILKIAAIGLLFTFDIFIVISQNKAAGYPIPNSGNPVPDPVTRLCADSESLISTSHKCFIPVVTMCLSRTTKKI